MVVVIGDHATHHKKYDAPLESDIDAVAGTVSGWMRRSLQVSDIASDAADAVASARADGQIASLILPADVSWTDGATPAKPVVAQPSRVICDPDGVTAALRSGEPTVIMVGGDATREAGLAAATRLAQQFGATVICETFPARLERGAGIPAAERLAYFAEAATAQLAGTRHLVLAGAASPVSFFAYPGKPSDLVPDGCRVHTLAGPVGATDALTELADALAPGVVDTDMQAQLRAADSAEFPAQAYFTQQHQDGLLVSAQDTATRILTYLARPDFGAEPVADIRTV